MSSRRLGGAQGEYDKKGSHCGPECRGLGGLESPAPMWASLRWHTCDDNGPFSNSLAIFMAMAPSDNTGSCHREPWGH